MKVIRVVGPSDSGKTTLVERLAERLADRGTVGTIKHISREPDLETAGTDTDRHRGAGAAVTYGLADEEGWFATGESLGLDGALERLGPTCDYALVEGYRDADLPTVVLGDPDDGYSHDIAATEALASAHAADEIDLESVLERIEDLEDFETLGSLVARVKRAADADRAGAIATFTGRVRERDGPDEEPTEYLEFERYDEVAETTMATIRTELEAREGVYDVRLHHRTGVVEAGEDIVFVVVLAGHRAEAFATVEDGIDRLKAEVPLFKKEVTVSEETWAHER